MINNSDKLVDKETAKSIVKTVNDLCSSRGSLSVGISSAWVGAQRWARNRASVTSDKRYVSVSIARTDGPVTVLVTTNQIDSESIKNACRYAEFYSKLWTSKEVYLDSKLDNPVYDSKGANVWSDVTDSRNQSQNANLVTNILGKVDKHGFLSAGYIEAASSAAYNFFRDPWARETFQSASLTQSHCSITVRERRGNGSGWGGQSSFDVGRIDLESIGDIALEKCILSLNPVRIEPGRYQTILEPQAASVFFKEWLAGLLRVFPDFFGSGEVYLETDANVGRHRSKLGLRVVDNRISIHHNPANSLMGTHKQEGVGPVTIIDKGILTSLWTDYAFSLNELESINPTVSRESFQVDGTETSVEEMISSMRRGVMVTRLSEPVQVNGGLLSGTTRDGFWLIENGKISKAIRNFRWVESPWFILNNVEQVGRTIPVFSPVDVRESLLGVMPSYANALSTMIVPWIKINDFSFTSTVDAV